MMCASSLKKHPFWKAGQKPPAMPPRRLWPLRAKAMLMPMAAAGHRFGLLLMMGGGLGGLPVLLNLGVVMLTGAVLVQLLTLPIEFDASRRALDELTRLKLVDEQELSGAKTMLTAAALTYVASAASSLAVVGVLMLSFLRRR
jgi:Zn-dependent membrane protease YugP